MNVVEKNAAEALLDRRLKINLPGPWVLRLFGRRTIPVFVKRPVAQNLFRMSRHFASMDIDLKEVKAGEVGTLLECVGRNGVTVSRIIATGMIRGNMGVFLFSRPLAWYIRCNMDMREMAELTKIIVLLSGVEDFVSTITSVSSLRLTTPTLSLKTES